MKKMKLPFSKGSKDEGSYPCEVTIMNPSSAQAEVQVPGDAKPGQTIHVILEATDNGSPQLTGYQRVIITVKK